ncbi:hypothetical protein [Streptomyces sp. NPDC002573]|uniref:hypothetical protein n=1 Tax=Streptomyces sp. NPDC002573 TaxID=3364651 RepID=UPI003691B51D
MEQRIGPSSQPLDGAGIDPAFIPGLTSPVSAERDSEEPEDAVPDGVKAAAVEPAEPVESVKSAESDGGAPEEETAADDAGSDDAEAEEKAPEGPVFEAADRRARIVADHSGVRLRLDDQECEFRWDEIGAVETQAARFGKRFTVTVHTPDRRWYPIEIEATARARFTEWETRLDEVLDAYFEDGEKEPAAAQDGD